MQLIVVNSNSCPFFFFLYRVRVMVSNATLNNISVMSWQSVLLVEETAETTDLSQITDKLYHIMIQNVVSSTPHYLQDSKNGKFKSITQI
jgi:hypothetical protein